MLYARFPGSVKGSLARVLRMTYPVPWVLAHHRLELPWAQAMSRMDGHLQPGYRELGSSEMSSLRFQEEGDLGADPYPDLPPSLGRVVGLRLGP